MALGCSSASAPHPHWQTCHRSRTRPTRAASSDSGSPRQRTAGTCWCGSPGCHRTRPAPSRHTCTTSGWKASPDQASGEASPTGSTSCTWLVGAGSVDNRRPGLPQYLQVKDERPLFDITHVEPDSLFPGQVGSSLDLPQSRHTWLDCQPAAHVVVVGGSLLGQRWPGADQRHVSPQYVPELGQLIQRIPAQPRADGRDPRVVPHLEEQPAALVLGLQRSLLLLRIAHHCAELVDGKWLLVLTHPGLPEQRGPVVGEPDRKRDAR